jgi:hypothetical protein
MLIRVVLIWAAGAAAFSVEVDSMGEYVVVETVELSRNVSVAPPAIRSVVACTAVDLSMDAGDLCDTPGFSKKRVYPDGDAEFEASLWKKSRLLMRGRVVKDNWPLVYLQVTVEKQGKMSHQVVRVPRKVRKAAEEIEAGRAGDLRVLGPVTHAPAGKHSETGVKGLVASLLAVMAVAFLVLAAIKGKFRRAIRKAVVVPRYDGRHYQLVLNQPTTPPRAKKPLKVRFAELVTGEAQTAEEWQESARRAQQAKDRSWGVDKGLLAPPPTAPSPT